MAGHCFSVAVPLHHQNGEEASAEFDTLMNSSTPLTRCNTCQTVFEVPQSILDSSDSRVRCGECLQVFDAGKNLHLVEKQDLSALAVEYEGAEGDDETQESSDTVASSDHFHTDSTSLESAFEQQDSGQFPGNQSRTVGAAGSANRVKVDQQQTAVTPKSSGSQPQEQTQMSDAQLENTHTDFDLFGRETELPEVSFEDSTMDAIRLDFDLVDDIDDETLSDTLFVNDVTIDAASHAARSASPADAAHSTAIPSEARQSQRSLESDADSDRETHSDSVGQKETTENTDDSDSVVPDRELQDLGETNPDAKSDAVSRAEKTLAAIAKSANTNFQLDDGAAPQPVEFDYRAPDAPQTQLHAQAQQAKLETSVPTTLEADALEQSSSTQPLASETLPGHDQTTQPPTIAPPSDAKAVKRWRWISRVFMAFLVLAIVGALYTWRNRGQLADNATTRPGYQLWCLFSECVVPARLVTSELAVLSKKIFSHPNLEDALVITIVIKNNAAFEQRYPKLFLWLSDRMRRTVASSEFAPEVYLRENDLAPDSTLGPGEQQRISIDVLDPGDEAVSLELDFR